MKKLLILTAVIVAGVAANASTFKWGAANIYGSDGTTKFTGTASLYCDALSSSALSVADVASGTISNTKTEFDVASAVGDTTYDFYFVIEDNGKAFTSAVKPVKALDVGTANIAFGNMQSATQNAGNWAAVPEPTSGLLLLLGIAGLALKRKRA